MLRSGILVFALVLAAHARGADLPPPAEWKIPPLEGELSGTFNPTFLGGGAPTVTWKLAIRPAKPLERSVEFSIEGPGLQLRGAAQIDPVGDGTWRVGQAKIDLADWFAWLAPRVTPNLAGVSMAGTVEMTGEGAWRHGKVEGHAELNVRDGRYEDPARKVLLEGISVDFDVVDLAKPETGPSQVFTFRSGHYDLVQLGVGRVEFSLDGEHLRIKKAAIDVFGGEMSIGSVEMSTKSPEFSAMAEMSGIEVGKILYLLPPILARAQGQLDGHVSLQRDAAGIHIGTGRLALREGRSAEIRLLPTPGVISSALPPKVNQLYPGLKEMESGGIPLKADALEFDFMPEGDAQGRTATIHVAGRPADPGFKGPLDLTVNVRGPLDELVNFGATSALRMMGGKKK